MTNEALVTGSTGETVRVGTAILASVSELVTREITISRTTVERVGVGSAELTSAPRLVATENVVTDSLWKTLGVVLGTVGLVSTGWVTSETVVFGFPG